MNLARQSSHPKLRTKTRPRRHRLNPTKEQILDAVKQPTAWMLEAFTPHTENPSQEQLEENARRYFSQAAREQNNPDLARKILSEDATRLSGKNGQRWRAADRRRPTPEDRTDVRYVLLLLLSEPAFGGTLTPDEQSLWKLWYDPADYTVTEISNQTGIEPRTLYRRHEDCVKKLAICYKKICESGADLPISLEALSMMYLWDSLKNDSWDSYCSEFCDIVRGADKDSPKALAYRTVLDEIADSTPGGIAVRGGGKKEKAFGTPKRTKRVLQI